jgi:hypothetical protein
LNSDKGQDGVSLPLGSFPWLVTLPELASTGDFIFMFPCFGSFTGDFHPISNAPMLGAHKRWGCSVGQAFRNFTRHPFSTLTPAAAVGKA